MGAIPTGIAPQFSSVGQDVWGLLRASDVPFLVGLSLLLELRDIALLLGFTRGVPRSPELPGRSIPRPARVLASSRLAGTVVIGAAASLSGIHELWALVPTVYCLTSGATRKLKCEAYYGQSYVGRIIDWLLDGLRVPAPDKWRHALAALAAGLIGITLITGQGKAGSMLFAEGDPSAAPAPEIAAGSEQTSRTAEAATPRPTPSPRLTTPSPRPRVPPTPQPDPTPDPVRGPTLERLCGDVLVPDLMTTPSVAAETLRAALQARWHLEGGLEIGCLEGVELVSEEFAVAWFKGGKSDPAAVVARGHTRGVLVLQDGVPLLKRLLEAGDLTSVDELYIGESSSFQIFRTTAGCMALVHNHGHGREELGEALTALLFEIVAQLDGALDRVVPFQQLAGRTEYLVTIDVDGGRLVFLLGETLDNVTVEAQPPDVELRMPPPEGGCPDAALHRLRGEATASEAAESPLP